jgi:hypothetical protein
MLKIFQDCLRCLCVDCGLLFELVLLIAAAMLSLYCQSPRPFVATPSCYDYVSHDSDIFATLLLLLVITATHRIGNCVHAMWFPSVTLLIRNRPSIAPYHDSHRIRQT